MYQTFQVSCSEVSELLIQDPDAKLSVDDSVSLSNLLSDIDARAPATSHLSIQQLATAIFRDGFVVPKQDNVVSERHNVLQQEPGEVASMVAARGPSACTAAGATYVELAQSSACAAFVVSCAAAGAKVDASLLGLLGSSYRSAGRISSIEALRLSVPPELRAGDDGLDMQLLRAYADVGLVDDATNLLRAITSSDRPPTARHMDILLSAFGAAGDLRGAWCCCRDMCALSLGGLPDSTTALRQLPQPDIGTVNALIKVCGQCGDVTKARLLFETVTHGDLLHVMATGSLSERADRQGPARGKLTHAAMSAAAGSILRGGSGMVLDDLPPPSSTSSLLDSGVASLAFLSSSVGHSMKGGAAMGSAAPQPMQGASRTSALESMSLYEMLTSMCERGQGVLAPDVHTYSALVCAYEAAGDRVGCQEAYQLLLQRVRAERESGSYTSTVPPAALEAVMDCLQDSGAGLETVQSVLSQSSALQASACPAVVGAVVAAVISARGLTAGQHAVQKLYRSLDRRPILMHPSFIRQYGRAVGRVLPARQAMEHLTTHMARMTRASKIGVELGSGLGAALIALASAAGDTPAIDSLVRRLSQDGVCPTPAWYTSLGKLPGQDGSVLLSMTTQDTYGVFRCARTACAVGTALAESGQTTSAATLLHAVASTDTAPAQRVADSITQAMRACGQPQASQDLLLLLDALLGSPAVALVLSRSECASGDSALLPIPEMLLEASFRQACAKGDTHPSVAISKAKKELVDAGVCLLRSISHAVSVAIKHAGTVDKDPRLACERFIMLARLLRGFAGTYTALREAGCKGVEAQAAYRFRMGKALVGASNATSEPYTSLLTALLSCLVAGVPVHPRPMDTLISTTTPSWQLTAEPRKVPHFLRTLLAAMVADRLVPGPSFVAAALQYAVPLGFAPLVPQFMAVTDATVRALVAPIDADVPVLGAEEGLHSTVWPGRMHSSLAVLENDSWASGRQAAADILCHHLRYEDAVIRYSLMAAASCSAGNALLGLWRAYSAFKRHLAVECLVAHRASEAMQDILPSALCTDLGVPTGSPCDITVLEALSIPADVAGAFLLSLASTVTSACPMELEDAERLEDEEEDTVGSHGQAQLGKLARAQDPSVWEQAKPIHVHAAVYAARSCVAGRCAAGIRPSIADLTGLASVYAVGGLRAEAGLLLRLAIAPALGTEYSSRQLAVDVRGDAQRVADLLQTACALPEPLPSELSLAAQGVGVTGAGLGVPATWRTGGDSNVAALLSPRRAGAGEYTVEDSCRILTALASVRLSQEVHSYMAYLTRMAGGSTAGSGMMCRRVAVCAYAALVACGDTHAADALMLNSRVDWSTVQGGPPAAASLLEGDHDVDASLSALRSAQALCALRVIGLAAAGDVLPAVRLAEAWMVDAQSSHAIPPLLAPVLSALLHAASSCPHALLVTSPCPDIPPMGTQQPYLKAKQLLGDDTVSSWAPTAATPSSSSGSTASSTGGVSPSSSTLVRKIESLARLAGEIGWTACAQDMAAVLRMYTRAREPAVAVEVGWATLDMCKATGPGAGRSGGSAARRVVLGGAARKTSMERMHSHTPLQGARSQAEVEKTVSLWMHCVARRTSPSAISTHSHAAMPRSLHPAPMGAPTHTLPYPSAYPPSMNSMDTLILVASTAGGQVAGSSLLGQELSRDTYASPSLLTAMYLAVAAAPAEAYARGLLGTDMSLALSEAAEHLGLPLGPLDASLADIIRSRAFHGGGCVDAPADIADTAGEPPSSPDMEGVDATRCSLDQLPFRLFAPQQVMPVRAALHLLLMCAGSPSHARSAPVSGGVGETLCASVGFETIERPTQPDLRAHAVQGLEYQYAFLTGPVLHPARHAKARVDFLHSLAAQVCVGGVPLAQLTQQWNALPPVERLQIAQTAKAIAGASAVSLRTRDEHVPTWPAAPSHSASLTATAASSSLWRRGGEGSQGSNSTQRQGKARSSSEVGTESDLKSMENEIMVLSLELEALSAAARASEQELAEVSAKHKLALPTLTAPARQGHAADSILLGTEVATPALRRALAAPVDADSRVSRIALLKSTLAELQVQERELMAAVGADGAGRARYSAFLSSQESFNREEGGLHSSVQEAEQRQALLEAKHAEASRAFTAAMQAAERARGSGYRTTADRLVEQRLALLKPLAVGSAAVSIVHAQIDCLRRAEGVRLQAERQAAEDEATSTVAAVQALASRVERKVAGSRSKVQEMVAQVMDVEELMRDLAAGEGQLRATVTSLRDRLETLQAQATATGEDGLPSAEPFSTASKLCAHAQLALDAARARLAVEQRVALSEASHASTAEARSEGEAAHARVKAHYASLADAVSKEYRKKCDEAAAALSAALEEQLRPVMAGAEQEGKAAHDRTAQLAAIADGLEAELESVTMDAATMIHEQMAASQPAASLDPLHRQLEEALEELGRQGGGVHEDGGARAEGDALLALLHELEYACDKAVFGTGEAIASSSPVKHRARMEPRAYLLPALRAYEDEVSRWSNSHASMKQVEPLSDTSRGKPAPAGPAAGLSLAHLRSRTSQPDPDMPVYRLGVGPSGARPLVRKISGAARSVGASSTKTASEFEDATLLSASLAGGQGGDASQHASGPEPGPGAGAGAGVDAALVSSMSGPAAFESKLRERLFGAKARASAAAR